MPVTLSIKNAPEHIVERLRARAARNHRSLQGELMSIVERAVETEEKWTLAQVRAAVKRLDLPAVSEAAEIVRATRDAR
jgi:plasmid stability protein